MRDEGSSLLFKAVRPTRAIDIVVTWLLIGQQIKSRLNFCGTIKLTGAPQSVLVRATGNDKNERHANNDVGNGHRLAARLDFAGPRDRGVDQISTHVRRERKRQTVAGHPCRGWERNV